MTNSCLASSLTNRSQRTLVDARSCSEDRSNIAVNAEPTARMRTLLSSEQLEQVQSLSQQPLAQEAAGRDLEAARKSLQQADADVSMSGTWIMTKLPATLWSYVEVGFTAVRRGRKTVARVEGLIVRIANQGFGVEWCQFGHPAVLAILLARFYRSDLSTAKQGSSL